MVFVILLENALTDKVEEPEHREDGRGHGPHEEGGAGAGALGEGGRDAEELLHRLGAALVALHAVDHVLQERREKKIALIDFFFERRLNLGVGLGEFSGSSWHLFDR